MPDRAHIDTRGWAERVEARLNAAPPRVPLAEQRETAKQRLHREQSAHTSRGMWRAALDRPCPRHEAAPGEPCWTGPVTGLCSARTQTPAAPATTRPAPRARREAS